MDSLDHADFPEFLDLLEYRAARADLVEKEMTEHPVNLDLLDSLVQSDQSVHLGHRD